MAQRLLALLIFLFWIEGLSGYRDHYVYSSWPRTSRIRTMRSVVSEFSFSFDKRGFLGRVAFDVDVVLPPALMTRNITKIDVRFDPSSDLDGKVYITRGGMGYDYATVHFQSEAEVGKMHAFVVVESSG